MHESDIIFELLYFALIEIRSRGDETGDAMVFHLADLMHNVPGGLAQAARGERTYADVHASLQAKADSKGCRAWLENIYAHLSTKATTPDDAG